MNFFKDLIKIIPFSRITCGFSITLNLNGLIQNPKV